MSKTPKKKRAFNHIQLHKCPTGIKGFDEITAGGLPKNRTTLVCGSAGAGKTLLGINFLIKGAVNYNEPGIFMSFEETEDELYKDVASLNLDLQGLVSRKKFCSSMCFWSAEIFKSLALILKECSFAWNMPLVPLAPNE